MSKELLFSLSKDNGDFVVEPYKGSGKGGQHRNKTMSGCRIKHPASGAVAECCSERSFYQNRKMAFQKLTGSDIFQKWLKYEIAKRSGSIADAEEYAEREINNSDHLKIEVQENGKWKELSHEGSNRI